MPLHSIDSTNGMMVVEATWRPGLAASGLEVIQTTSTDGYELLEQFSIVYYLVHKHISINANTCLQSWQPQPAGISRHCACRGSSDAAQSDG